MSYVDLWERLLGALRERAAVPFDADRLTPSEIARYASEKLGDDRAGRFVWEFYYPAIYGGQKTSGPDSRAVKLVEELERSMTAPSTPEESRCSLCGRRR